MPHRPLSRKVNRHALYTFVALSVIFVAQLSWWAIFHVRVVDQRFAEYQDYSASRGRELALALAPEYEAARDLLLLESSLLDQRAADSLTRALARNRFVGGVVVTDQAGDTVFRYGSEGGDAGARIAKEGTTIVVALDYSAARKLAGAFAPRLSFVPPHPDSVFFAGLSAANFTPDSADFASHLDDRESSRIMTFWEGGFFLALTALGLGLIFRALVRSEEARSMQENFLMAVTHELRTPLASLKLSVQGLRRGKLPGERAEQVNQMIDSDLQRLEGLISDLLEAGKAHKERVVRPEPVPLAKFTRSYFASRDTEMRHRGATVTLELEPAKSAEVYIAPHDLKRALDIAVDNALKFSDGNPELTVSCGTTKDRGFITVRDRGIGIDRENLERVFDRFYRVGNELTRARPGTGLGLYLAREILRAYKGEMSIDSAGIGQGTSVTLTIPQASNSER